MAKWKCPNKAQVPDHVEKILFTDEDSSLSNPFAAAMEVPRIEYCDVCNRHYTRAECTTVEK